MKSTQDVLDHILACFGTGDIDGILRDYTEETTFLGPDGPVRGLAEMQEFFEEFVGEFGHPEATFEMKSAQVHGEVAMITWSGSTPKHEYAFGTDTWIVREGKITHQTWCWEGESRTG